MSALPKYPGIPKTLGGVEYIIPPISLRALQLLKPQIDTFSNEADIASMDTVTQALHAALLRNYPDITYDEVGDMIDVGNMFELFEMVMDVSGLKRKAYLEAQAGGSGEGKPNQG